MDEKKKLCTSCKLILPGDFAYCPMCGGPVIDQEAPLQTPPYERPLEDDNPILLERLSGALAGKKGLIIGIIALALLVLGAIVVFSLTQSPNSEPIAISSETPTPSPTPSPTPTATPTPTPTFFPTPTPTFFPTPTPTFVPTATPTPTVTPTGTPITRIVQA
jgi:hypothetical protein